MGSDAPSQLQSKSIQSYIPENQPSTFVGNEEITLELSKPKFTLDNLNFGELSFNQKFPSFQLVESGRRQIKSKGDSAAAWMSFVRL